MACPPPAEPRVPRRVVVALSGGVDSSVAAALARDLGDDAIGVTLQLRRCEEAGAGRSCCGIDGLARARAVAGCLGIPHYAIDCSREFEDRVLRPAWDAYAQGRTPSPCLPCNRHIKFGLLRAWALRAGASAVVTGHYARILQVPGEGPGLFRALDRDRDQSYFLASLPREALSAVGFPLGTLTKPQVRAIAGARGLPTFQTPDSQDACLTSPGQSFPGMLRARFGGEPRPGPVVDECGRVLGRHPGIHEFTVGQRKGMGIPSGGRMWVRTIRAEDAALVVTGRPEGLDTREIRVGDVNWLVDIPAGTARACEVQVRSRHAAAPATVEIDDDGTVRTTFARPVRAVAPGQAAVFYDGDRVLGQGWIDATD
jgi:tRNA-specific 2-thiouridylase